MGYKEFRSENNETKIEFLNAVGQMGWNLITIEENTERLYDFNSDAVKWSKYYKCIFKRKLIAE